MIGNFNLGRRKCYRQYQLNVKFMSNLPIYKWEEQISRNPSLLKIQWPLHFKHRQRKIRRALGTPREQKLWTSFKSGDIYRFLTREPDTVSEYSVNWITVTHLSVQCDDNKKNDNKYNYTKNIKIHQPALQW